MDKKAGEEITIGIQSQKDEDYYNTAKNGGYDLIFSTWGGAAINPYGLMQVYCDSTFDSCCEYGFKGKQNDVNIDIDANGNGTIDDGENKILRTIDAGSTITYYCSFEPKIKCKK